MGVGESEAPGEERERGGGRRRVISVITMRRGAVAGLEGAVRGSGAGHVVGGCVAKG